MEKETKDLIKQAQTAPAIIGASSGIEGMEETDSDDIRIPRVKLLQGSSEETKNPDIYPDLRVGMLINSLSHAELISEKIGDKKHYPFIPVKMFKSWMKFNPYTPEQEGFDSQYEPGQMIFKTYDKSDPITKSQDSWRWKQINFLGFQPKNPLQPIFVTFGSMSRPIGNEIINIVQLAARPLFEHLFLLGSKTESRNGNTFMVFTARSEGRPDEALCEIGRKMYNEFNPLLADLKKMKVELHDEDVITEAPESVEFDD